MKELVALLLCVLFFGIFILFLNWVMPNHDTQIITWHADEIRPSPNLYSCFDENFTYTCDIVTTPIGRDFIASALRRFRKNFIAGLKS